MTFAAKHAVQMGPMDSKLGSRRPQGPPFRNQSGFRAVGRFGFTGWHLLAGVVAWGLPGAGYACGLFQTNPDTLQENNQTISDFVRRTDYLAAALGLNLSEIPEKIGISKAMLYAYRSGKNRITNKVWIGLEAAEEAADIEKTKRVNVSRETLKKGCDAENAGNPKDIEMGDDHFREATKLMEDSAEYLAKPTCEAVLVRIAMALEEIARKLPD